MKSTVSSVPKDVPAQVESTYEWAFPIQRTAIDWVMLAKETLPNATPLTPEERISINEYFWSHFK